jgi:hypothetical protein
MAAAESARVSCIVHGAGRSRTRRARPSVSRQNGGERTEGANLAFPGGLTARARLCASGRLRRFWSRLGPCGRCRLGLLNSLFPAWWCRLLWWCGLVPSDGLRHLGDGSGNAFDDLANVLDRLADARDHVCDFFYGPFFPGHDAPLKAHRCIRSSNVLFIPVLLLTGIASLSQCFVSRTGVASNKIPP